MSFIRAATLLDSRFSFTIFILDQPPLLPPQPPPTTSQQPSHNNHQPQRRFTTTTTPTATTFTVTTRPRNHRITAIPAPLVDTDPGLVQGAHRAAGAKTPAFPRNRIKNDSRPLLFRPISERGAIWPRLQARRSIIAICRFADQK